MLALVGFAVGYVVGAQQGREGLNKLITSFTDIQKSEEFAALVETAQAMVGQMLQQAIQAGAGVLSGEVKDVVGRRLRAA